MPSAPHRITSSRPIEGGGTAARERDTEARLVRALRNLTLRSLSLRPGELGRTLSLHAALLCVAFVFFLGRTIRDTLFLAHYDFNQLPWMYVWFGLASSPIALFFGRIAGRFRRERLFVGYLLFVAATDIAVYLIVHADRAHGGGYSWIYPVYYVWADVSANLMFVLFWMLANDLHTSRDAKRLYGLIGLGSVSGLLISGVGGRAALAALTVDQLLFVLVGAIAILAALVLRIGTHYPKVTPAQPIERAAEAQVPWGYVGILVSVLLATYTAAEVIDYQWKFIAKESFHGEALARYFMVYNIVVGLVAFAFQVFFTQKILSRLGVMAGMLVMPLMMGSGSAWLLFTPGILAASFMKFAYSGFQFTINDATYQILYYPFPSAKKAQVRMVIDGAAKPLGYTAGGLVLILIARHLSVPHLAWISLPMIGLWIALAVMARRGYVRSLAATLSSPTRGRGDEGPPDAAERKVLEEALTVDDPAQVRWAAERLLQSRAAELPEIVTTLCDHRDPEVRRLALDASAREALTDLRDRAAELAAHDPSPEVRGAAFGALGAADPEGTLETLEVALASPDQAVSHGALAALLRWGSLDGMLAAGGPLKALLRSEDPRERQEAAELLRRVGNPSFYRPLIDLLRDPDKRVRMAACTAAAELRHPRLIEPLVAAAALRGSRTAAAQSLAAFDVDAVEPIVTELRAEHRLFDPFARRRLANTLGHIHALPAFRAALAALPPEADARVRYALAKSAVRLRRELALPPLAPHELKPLLDRELCVAYELDAGASALARLYPQRPLLDEALRLALGHARRRVLRLLSLAHPPELLALIDRNLEARDPAARANAVEVLDNLLSPAAKLTVLPLLDAAAGEGSAAERVARLRGLLPLDVPSADALLVRLSSGRDPFLAACAFAVAAKNRVAACAAPARAILDEATPAPIVKETAALLLARLEGSSMGESMYTTTEKILFLKGVNLFSEVPGEDLVALARSAEVIDAPAGRAVVREGEIGDALYVVLTGGARVERAGHELARLKRGECFGEMAVLDREPRSASVIATEPSQMLRIAQDDFYEILADHAEIAEGILRVLTHRLRQAIPPA